MIVTNTCGLPGWKILFLVAAALFHGTIRGSIVIIADAFRVTKFSEYPSCQFPSSFSRPYKSVTRGGHSTRLRGRFSRALSDVISRPYNAAFINSMKEEHFYPHKLIGMASTCCDVIDASPKRQANSTSITIEACFPEQQLDAEKPLSLLVPTKSGKNRGATNKIRRKFLSHPIESRLLRTLLFPLKVLIWNPLRMMIEISISRLNEGQLTDLNYGRNTTFLFSTKKKECIDGQFEPIGSVPSDLAASTSASEKNIEAEVVDIDKIKNIPKGDRWAVAAPGVDLSGKWELLVSDDFKKKYDKYLERLGQPKIVRTVALSGPVIGQTMEELAQIDQGRSLIIRGKNVRGTWDRTLVASGTTKYSDTFEPLITLIPTVDKELVKAEAWWEKKGKVHVSWMRGVTMYGGGSFCSRRYFEAKELQDDETVYVCESFFRFDDPNQQDNNLTWRFRRRTKN